MKKTKKTTTNRSKNAKALRIIKKNKSLQKIDKKMTFGEILNRYPSAGEIVMSHGLHCIGCGMAFQETLEQGAIMHGLDPDKLVNEINKEINQKVKKKK